MPIRIMFLLLTSALICLLGGLGLWQTNDSHNKVKAVDWLQKNNLFVDFSQQAAVELAVERGLTAHLLELKERQVDLGMLESRLQQQREIVNEKFATMQHMLQALAHLEEKPLLKQFKVQLQHLQQQLHSKRTQVTQTLQHQGEMIRVAQWIADISVLIEELHSFSGMSMLPLEGNIYSYAAQPIVKDVLFTLAEYLGRERAILVAAITRDTALSVTEQQLLLEQESVINQTYQRAQAILHKLPAHLALEKEQQALEKQLVVYQKMRQAILHSSQTQGAYAISSEAWFAQASLTIDSVYQVTRTINTAIDQAINDLKRNAQWAQIIAGSAFLLLVVLLALSAYWLHRRVLRPLGLLTRGAAKIAQGQLEKHAETAHFYDRQDEVSLLANTFEYMRQQLVADQVRQAEQTQELRKLYSAIDQSIVAVLITDNQGIIEYTNTHFEKVTGYSFAELKGKKTGMLSSGETSSQLYKELWSTILAGKVWMGELLNKRKNGDYYWALVSIGPIMNEQGQITHFIDIQLDISEHKSVAERLDFVSHYHQTTNLPNRHLLQLRFKHASQKACQRQEMMAMISISIGRLKHINDSFGWEVGDQMLRQVGQRLKATTRLQDTVAHQEGGKFTILLHPVENAQDALARAKNLVECLAEPISIEDYQLQLLPKAGVSLVDGKTLGFEQVIKHADMALHNAEQNSDAVRLYNSEMDVNSQQRLVMESALRVAFNNQSFELHYQPKIIIETGEIWAVEALLRWPSQDAQRYTPPSVFIPVAESSGLIHSLGDWVLTEACLQAARWREQGLPDIVMAVNVSAEQFRQADFITRVVSILEQTQMPPDRLELELTESIFVEDLEQALSILKTLKELGIKLAIDDFGTGYSSLSYLSWLPVDSLKIDRSFVEHITTDLRAAAIVTSIITLAQRMGLKVIAEGVETQGQLNYLAQHGCGEIQGYYFSRPLAQEAATDKLQHYLPVPLISLTRLAAPEKV